MQALEPRLLFSFAYAVVDLGTLGGASAVATDINTQGVVVGYSLTASHQFHAIRYDGALHDLGSLGGDSFARAISDQGVVVGDSFNSDGQDHAFRWDAHGGMSDLETLGGSSSSANAINLQNTIVGIANTPADHGHAFRIAGGEIANSSDLKIFSAQSSRFSTALGINAHGAVVGQADLKTTQGHRHHPFLFSNGSARDLLANTAYANGQGSALAINDDGTAVGYLQLSNNAGQSVDRAAVFSAGHVTLLPRTASKRISRALDINNDGVIVGVAYGPLQTDPAATIFSGGKSRNLNNLIDPASGWNLQSANAINDDGIIVGSGVRNGANHAFMLVPTLGSSAGDTIRPRAQLRAYNISSPFSGDYLLRVKFTDNIAFHPASANVDGDDVLIENPHGVQTFATLVGINLSDGKTRVGVFSYPSPSGHDWTSADNGIYKVYIHAQELFDAAGNSLPGKLLGTFKVNIPPALATPV